MLAVFLPVYCSDESLKGVVGGEFEDMSLYGYTSSMKESSKRGMHISRDSERKEKVMRLLYKPVKVIVGPLQK